MNIRFFVVKAHYIDYDPQYVGSDLQLYEFGDSGEYIFTSEDKAYEIKEKFIEENPDEYNYSIYVEEI